jgi:glycosyltransferase involved in cell wall biosynthesis
VLAQDYPAIEYIVVDPGSTDGSRELIESFASRLAAVLFEPDQGAADGLNKGFQRASGDIFGFLNSDDVLLPGAMKSVSQAFEQNPDCDIVMGNGFIIDAQGGAFDASGRPVSRWSVIFMEAPPGCNRRRFSGARRLRRWGDSM